MKEYKMRRGEHLDDRMPDLKGSIEEYFGEVTDTEEWQDHELYVVEDPDNPSSTASWPAPPSTAARRTSLRSHFEERPPKTSSRKGTPTPPPTRSTPKRVPAGGDRSRREVPA